MSSRATAADRACSGESLSPTRSGMGTGSPTRTCATQSVRGVAGFTLIEVLVALSLVAAVIAAIGSLIGASVRGTRALDFNLTAATTARAIAGALPEREALRPGSLSGETAGQRWRVDVRPMAAPVDPGAPTKWVPYTVVIRLQSPTGSIMEIDTVRLRRREGG
jgi:general secretion pathway protein I